MSVTGNDLQKYRPFVPRPKPCSPPRRPKVTVAIGLLCQDCIIVASDSQTTRGAVKNQHAQKISVIDFADSQILVAEAGVADLSEAAIAEIRAKAAGKPLNHPNEVTEIVKSSVQNVHKHFWELNHLSGRPQEEAKWFFADPDYNFSLIVAFYYDNRPYLYTINLSRCLPIETVRHYEAIGIGRDLGEYLMDENIPTKVAFEDAYPMLVYVVEKVIDNVDGCGRPTWVGFAVPIDYETRLVREKIGKPFHKNLAFKISREEIDSVVEELKMAEPDDTAARKQRIKAIMEKVTKKRMDRFWHQKS